MTEEEIKKKIEFIEDLIHQAGQSIKELKREQLCQKKG